MKTIKVVKKSIQGWLSTDFNSSEIEIEIQDQERQGWQLVSTFGIRTSASLHVSTTDTLVFIYRKQQAVSFDPRSQVVLGNEGIEKKANN